MIAASASPRSCSPAVDGVGGAQLLRQREAFAQAVDGDDGRGRGEGGGHDRGQADRSGAEDDDRGTGDGLQYVPHGADTGLHSAAQRGDGLQRHVRVDLDEAALVDQGPLGEGGLAEEVPAERLAVPAEGAGAVGPAAADEVQRQPGGAVRGVTAVAVAAVAAGGEGQYDVVAGSHTGDGGPDGLDDSGALVPEDSGQREGQSAARHAEVGVAQAGRDHPDDRLAGSGLVEGDVGEGEGCAAGLDDRGTGGEGHRGNSLEGAQSSETTTDLTLV